MMTPENVHYGRTELIIAVRQRTLNNAYSRKPERFVLKQPMHVALPTAAWINPPAQSKRLKARAAPQNNVAICLKSLTRSDR